MASLIFTQRAQVRWLLTQQMQNTCHAEDFRSIDRSVRPDEREDTSVLVIRDDDRQHRLFEVSAYETHHIWMIETTASFHILCD
jgi:hypothetical protein